MNQDYLNEYFGNVWRNLPISEPLNYDHSGRYLVDKISSGEAVVDIGCGKNRFKQFIPNLIGVDPAFTEADYNMSLQEFSKVNDQLFDVALCLGSINFGDKDFVESQIQLVIDMLKPTARIYWRSNPGRKDHGTPESQNIEFYPWTFEEHIRLAEKFNFKIVDLRWETDNRRIYAEWKR